MGRGEPLGRGDDRAVMSIHLPWEGKVRSGGWSELGRMG
jgi:hypothetical protein